jgi:hypothetical protein
MAVHSKLERIFSTDNIAFKTVNFASLVSFQLFLSSAKFNFKWRSFKMNVHSFQITYIERIYESIY